MFRGTSLFRQKPRMREWKRNSNCLCARLPKFKNVLQNGRTKRSFASAVFQKGRDGATVNKEGKFNRSGGPHGVLLFQHSICFYCFSRNLSRRLNVNLKMNKAIHWHKNSWNIWKGRKVNPQNLCRSYTATLCLLTINSTWNLNVNC